MVMSHSDPEANPDFWAIRNSVLPATPEMERAADLLNEAADMIIAGRDAEAAALIHQADITTLFDLRDQAVRAAPILHIHRVRKVANLLPTIPKEHRAPPFKSESPLGEAVFRRDGWRCRYCGCRVIPSRVRRWIDKRLPGAIRWDQATNSGCHAGFWTLWGSVDHVIPRARGGRNEADNLVTACMVCNFAREHFTLEQLGLADPRSRPPVLDGWDGLTRLCGEMTRRATASRSKSRARRPPPGQGVVDDLVQVTEGSKSAAGTLPISAEKYCAQLAVHLPDSAESLMAFLANLDEVGVVAEFVRAVMLRFPVGNGSKASAGSIPTSGRLCCSDAYYYARKYSHPEIGERYLAAVAGLTDGEIRGDGRDIPEVFGRDGRQINVAALLPNSEPWKNAIATFVRDMQAAIHSKP
jgi:5-methylcytosine-specific restriction endonuclease McrA